MTSTYATARVAYQELRAAVAPWASGRGFTRWAGTQAGWQQSVDADCLLRFKFEGYSMVNPDTGNSYDGLVQLEPRVTQTSEILRQSPFSCCLVQAELDELARIQGAINARRPPLPAYLRADLHRDSLLGHGLRATYDPSPRYAEGYMISFGYHTVEDARELAAFIARALPQALERFMQGQVAKPIATTPPHLKPRWLRDLK